jgi:acetate kinase
VERVALEAFRGHEPFRTVFATFVREIIGAVGAAATILGGMDALIFVGDRALASHRFRTAVCAGLGAWGVELPLEGPVVPFEVTPLHDVAKTPVFAASVNEDELVAREVGRFLGDPGVGPTVPPSG